MKISVVALLLLLQELPVPELTGRVVDQASVLSADEERQLTARLETLERETSTQIVVVTIPTLRGEPIEDYTLRVAETWGIGQRDLDNGIVLLVAVEDRRVRIEVGYGLESVIPDGLAGRIIRERITPAFRQGEFFGGLWAAVEGLELAARREYPEAAVPDLDFDAVMDSLTWLFLLFVVQGWVSDLLGILAAMLLGAVAVPLLTALSWLWGALLGAAMGLVAALFARMDGGGWNYSGGGWSSGGGSWGGGGFSGGGGSFGGGGASGSW